LNAQLKPLPLFSKIAAGIDVSILLKEIVSQPELWNKNPCRLSKHAPHHETQDMILRYRDETIFRESGRWSSFVDEHIPMWNRAIDYLPAARKIIFDLFSYLNGEILGGVFIYKLQPGTQILPHVDRGWHPEFYDKFNVCLSSNLQTAFYYDYEAMMQECGDIHWFRNDVKHWVKNDGTTDHIVMTVCVRLDRKDRAPWSPPDWHPDKVN
jgi:hypothetical protein